MRFLFILALAFASLSCSCQPRGGGRPMALVQHDPWNSDADPDTRPSATRDGAAIKLRPSGATFRVPEDWLDWHQKFGNNIHLTHGQLDAVARGDGEWDAEYASVCNTVLPFDRCAAHVGGEGWGKQSVSWADLQVRVYDLDETPEAIEGRIEKDGVADIERFSGHRPNPERDATGEWRRTVLSFPLWYGDYRGSANVDFRTRRFGGRSLVFAFMYAGSDQPHGTAIAAILGSFDLE